MIKRELNEILEYLSDHAIPIESKKEHEPGSQTAAILNQAMEEIRKRDALVRQWIEDSDKDRLLLSLIAITQMSSIEEPFKSIKSNYTERWDFHLVDLIYQACIPDCDKLENIIGELSKNSVSNSIAGELTRWFYDE